jgi:DNA primase catalytic subunit
MERSLAEKYYSRDDIAKAILKFAKDREVGTQFDGYFGKRPDMLEYLSDVKDLIKKGIFSFHLSEERWANPLLLGNNKLSEEEKNKNRIGWDLILDLDGVDFVYSKIVGKIIIEFLYELGIKNVSTKFSGNKGFHIGIPFEAFSTEIIGIGKTSSLFPEAARKIAVYLMIKLKDKISKAILDYEGGIEKISKKYEIPIKDLKTENGEFNYMKVIEIDTILISSRHLFRAPYSLNEKSGLVSIPVKNENINDFEKFLAKPEKIDPKKYEKFEFLNYNPEFGKDGNILLTKAYDSDLSPEDLIDIKDLERRSLNSQKNIKSQYGKITSTGNFDVADFEINEKIDIKDFPETIKFTLENNFPDGKKRALFLLLTFLYSIKYSEDVIKQLIEDWTNKQENPLKPNYINAQITWFKSQSKTISPPNFNNDNYYKSIGIPKELIIKDKKKFKNVTVKNPLHYVYLLLKTKPQKRKKKEK